MKIKDKKTVDIQRSIFDGLLCIFVIFTLVMIALPSGDPIEEFDYGTNVQYSDSQELHPDAKIANLTIKEMREFVTLYELHTDNLQAIILAGGDLDDLDLGRMLTNATTYEAFKKMLAERE